MGGIGDFLFGSSDKIKRTNRGTPGQQQLHENVINQANQSAQSGGGYYGAQQYNQNLLSGQGYEQFAQPYMQEFMQKILPMIEEKYAGMGALSSSGFGQGLASGASDLQSKLAQLFTHLQQQAVGQEYGQYNQNVNQGLNYDPYNYEHIQGGGGIFKPALTGALTAFGGPIGAAAAYGINSLSSQNRGGGLS